MRQVATGISDGRNSAENGGGFRGGTPERTASGSRRPFMLSRPRTWRDGSWFVAPLLGPLYRLRILGRREYRRYREQRLAAIRAALPSLRPEDFQRWARLRAREMLSEQLKVSRDDWRKKG